MPLVSIATPFFIDLEFRTASAGRRGLAWLIDIVILFLYELAFSRAIGPALPDDEVLRTLIIVLGMALPVLLYHFLMELFFHGQSIGKKLLGIRVVNITGNEAGISQYLIRLLFRAWFLVPVLTMVLVSMFYDLTGAPASALFAIGMLLLLGAAAALLIYFLANKKGQRLGDTLANTLVIEDRARTALHQTIYLDIHSESYQPRYPEVMRLTDRDINGIRNLLSNRRSDREHEAYMERIAARIAEALQIETELPAQLFLEQLLYDYNFLTSGGK
jgi:uncharacterized RDD family membrane protein YckC